MAYLQASLLIASGLVVIAWLAFGRRLSPEQIEAVMPVQAFLAIATAVTGLSWIIRGPLRIFSGPVLLVVALVGLSYGGALVGACLAFPHKTPKPVQAIAGSLALVAGVLLLLFQLRVIKPI